MSEMRDVVPSSANDDEGLGQEHQPAEKEQQQKQQSVSPLSSLSCFVRGIARVSGFVDVYVGKFFQLLGRLNVRKPLLVILGAVVVCIGLGIGILFLPTEHRTEKLWTPQDSDNMKNRGTTTHTVYQRRHRLLLQLLFFLSSRNGSYDPPL
jgi:hypothetical protein